MRGNDERKDCLFNLFCSLLVSTFLTVATAGSIERGFPIWVPDSRILRFFRPRRNKCATRAGHCEAGRFRRLVFFFFFFFFFAQGFVVLLKSRVVLRRARFRANQLKRLDH